MAMRIRRYGAKLIAQYGRSRATLALDAAIGQEIAPYCPSGRHGHRFRHNKSSCGVVKLLFEASVQKARNGPSTHVIEATSCVERSNATIKAEEHS